MAFETVCPERTDLIHKNYRKLCNLLVDVDEWGQVMILTMLTRYARSQFVDPNKEVSHCAAAPNLDCASQIVQLIETLADMYTAYAGDKVPSAHSPFSLCP
jgi:NAD-specific glutamate dehydrogenase